MKQQITVVLNNRADFFPLIRAALKLLVYGEASLSYRPAWGSVNGQELGPDDELGIVSVAHFHEGPGPERRLVWGADVDLYRVEICPSAPHGGAHHFIGPTGGTATCQWCGLKMG